MTLKRLLKTALGFLCFFLPTAVAVGVSILIFAVAQGWTDSSPWLIALLMVGVSFALALIAYLVDYFRRKLLVERRVEEILQGTQRIAAGDFSVRFSVLHKWDEYDDFDRIKENLNTLVKELSKTEMLHSDFISSVSHEIKTPLAVIKSYAGMLCKGGKDEETRRRYAKALVEASDRLNALVANILKLNKLENGELLPEGKTIDAGEALAEMIVGMETLIESKGLQLETHIEEAVRLSAPEGYWEILCGNLLSNAVKFTDGGGKITVRLYTEGGDVVFSVADTGCGISCEEGKRIFDKFYQADSSRKSEGNGLGLALVKKVIQRMGGEISVESELGKGSVFTVRLQGE